MHTSLNKRVFSHKQRPIGHAQCLNLYILNSSTQKVTLPNNNNNAVKYYTFFNKSVFLPGVCPWESQGLLCQKIGALQELEGVKDNLSP